MYYDMSMEGQECPNEAEFRSYGVLLNLNQGDTLRSIQTLALEVRTSPEIKFAMKVLTAVNTNNYVKFFKLVRESTLLQVKHCYFFLYSLLIMHTYLIIFDIF